MTLAILYIQCRFYNSYISEQCYMLGHFKLVIKLMWKITYDIDYFQMINAIYLITVSYLKRKKIDVICKSYNIDLLYKQTFLWRCYNISLRYKLTYLFRYHDIGFLIYDISFVIWTDVFVKQFFFFFNLWNSYNIGLRYKLMSLFKYYNVGFFTSWHYFT